MGNFHASGNPERYQTERAFFTKRKKTLLLAISHDIKIPLSAIKLYARSIYEKVADDEESQISCGHKIEQHADEIEDFVQKIMEAASNEVLAIEVKTENFI